MRWSKDNLTDLHNQIQRNGINNESDMFDKIVSFETGRTRSS